MFLSILKVEVSEIRSKDGKGLLMVLDWLESDHFQIKCHFSSYCQIYTLVLFFFIFPYQSILFGKIPSYKVINKYQKQLTSVKQFTSSVLLTASMPMRVPCCSFPYKRALPNRAGGLNLFTLLILLPEEISFIHRDSFTIYFWRMLTALMPIPIAG